MVHGALEGGFQDPSVSGLRGPGTVSPTAKVPSRDSVLTVGGCGWMGVFVHGPAPPPHSPVRTGRGEGWVESVFAGRGADHGKGPTYQPRGKVTLG